MDNFHTVGKLAKPPLVYTAGVVSINLKDIDEYIGKIQDTLKENYPGSSEMEMSIKQINPVDGDISDKKIKHYAINAPDLNWGVLITEQQFIFHTVKYKTFDEFYTRFSEALSTVMEITGTKYHSGLAFRQIDNFELVEGEQKLSDCVNERFLSMDLPSSISNDGSRFLRQEHRHLFEDKTSVVLRTYTFESSSGPSIPEDLLPWCIGLNYKLLEQNIKEPPFLLADFEVGKQLEGKSEKILVQKIEKDFRKFHEHLYEIFNQVIKQDALERRT